MKKISFDGHKNLIAGALRQIRIDRGMSQSRLAAKMQTYGIAIDQQMISKIEHDRRIVTDYELAYFCVVFDISPSALFPDLTTL